VTAPLSIADFLDRQALLGPHFEGQSWDRWRAVLRAAFGPPMSDRPFTGNGPRRMFYPVAVPHSGFILRNASKNPSLTGYSERR
jgi:hypothetical protein